MPLALILAALISQHPPYPIVIDGQPFTELRADAPKPYLHPLRTASGKVITRQYPMAEVSGETRDHPHHRGLWFSHGDVNGWDFWANEETQKGVGKGRGIIKITKLEPHKGGKPGVSPGVSFDADWTTPEGTLIKEHRDIRVSGSSNMRIVDMELTLFAVRKVVFGDTKEGTLALRLRDELIEKNGGIMINAEGATGEKAVWGKPSPWVDYSGTLEGETVGVAIFDHPENPRHPTRWHSRAYGLFAANIFGLHDFENDKTKDGSLTLEKGKSLRFRYRILIHPGDAKAAGIATLYNEYVH